MTPKELAKKAIEIAKRNPEVRKAVLAACRSATLIEDYALEDETQKLLLEGLRANDLIQITYAVAPGLPDRKVRHRVLLDYDPSTHSILLGTKDTDSVKNSPAFMAEKGGNIVYGIGPRSEGFKVLKLRKEPKTSSGDHAVKPLGGH